MKILKTNLLALSAILIMGCGSDPIEPSVNPTGGDWLVNANEVFDGGPGKDGIPSVDSPVHINVADVDFQADNDLVDVVYYDGAPVAYGHQILDWHEIVNDNRNGISVAVTYCPLTGTGIGWSRMVNGSETEFGVSGLLYNTNLIPFDRNSDSNWSQIRQDCINGDLIGETIDQVQLIEMRWDAFKEGFPDAVAISEDTGFTRDYNAYPYGDYRTNNDRLLFPVNSADTQLPRKERVLGVLDGADVTVFTFDVLEMNNGIIHTTIGERNIIVFGERSRNFINAMEIPASDVGNYRYDSGMFPNVLVHNDDTRYNLFGDNTDAEGEDLAYAANYIGYYFSFPAFFDVVTVFE